MFGEQQMNSGEIVANFGLGHNVTHFFDPILFLCHIPVELPKLSGFFQTGSTFHCQTYKFSIGIFQTWKSKEKFQTSFDKLRHIWTSLDQSYKNGYLQNPITMLVVFNRFLFQKSFDKFKQVLANFGKFRQISKKYLNETP